MCTLVDSVAVSQYFKNHDVCFILLYSTVTIKETETDKISIKMQNSAAVFKKPNAEISKYFNNANPDT